MSCFFLFRALRYLFYDLSFKIIAGATFLLKYRRRFAIGLLLLVTLWPLNAYSEKSLIAPYAHRALMLDGVVLENNNIIAVGERGIILISTDHAESWVQAEVPTRANLTAVTFVDNHIGWAVGHDAVILGTRDGGTTWELMHQAPDEERPLLDVWCEDATHCYAIGAYGYFLATKDGGETWQSKLISEDDWHLNQIKASDSGKLYIAAEAGAIYRSDDGGNSWKTLPSPYEGSFFGVLPLAGEAVLIFGLRGNLYRSENAGESWQRVDTDTEAMLNCGAHLPEGRVLIAGLAGTILISKDDGKTFSFFQQPDRLGISATCWVPDMALAVFGEGGARKIDVP